MNRILKIVCAALAVAALAVPLASHAQGTPALQSVAKGPQHEEDNLNGWLPIVADDDPVLWGKLEGIKSMAREICVRCSPSR